MIERVTSPTNVLENYSVPEVEEVKLTAQYSFLTDDSSGPKGTGDDWELIDD